MGGMVTVNVAPKRGTQIGPSTEPMCGLFLIANAQGQSRRPGPARRLRESASPRPRPARAHRSTTRATPPRPVAVRRLVLLLERDNVEDAEPLAGAEVDLLARLDHLRRHYA
jgi:hypothetical protein